MEEYDDRGTNWGISLNLSRSRWEDKKTLESMKMGWTEIKYEKKKSKNEQGQAITLIFKRNESLNIGHSQKTRVEIIAYFPSRWESILHKNYSP